MPDMPLLYQQVAHGDIYAEDIIKLKLDGSSFVSSTLAYQRFLLRNQSRLSPAQGGKYHIVALYEWLRTFTF
jgi:hypothetical protein